MAQCAFPNLLNHRILPTSTIPQVHLLNLHALLVVVLWKVLAETVGLGLIVSRVRNLVMNGLGMVLPYNRGCGMEWWGGGQCQECRSSRGPGALSEDPQTHSKLSARKLLTSQLGEQKLRVVEKNLEPRIRFQAV